MHCDGSITIMWSLNVFINGFTSPCLRVKTNSFVKWSQSDLHIA